MRVIRLVFLGGLAVVVTFACGGREDLGDSNGTARWAVCAHNSECTVAPKTCCGVCGKPVASDVVGVNEAELEAHRKEVCAGGGACPACVAMENPALVATCAAETCAVVDVRRDAASACTKDGDCRLRVPECCECGGSRTLDGLIAINASRAASYAAIVCDPGQACDDCLPQYPSNVEAYCASDGHCDVRPAAQGVCALPFEVGPCNAAMPVFAFVDGACVARTYGGCGGNENRFASLEQCMATCEGRPDPNGCPEGRARSSVCVACGPIGGCGERATVCAKVCTENADCDAPLAFCNGGLCEAGGCI